MRQQSSHAVRDPGFEVRVWDQRGRPPGLRGLRGSTTGDCDSSTRRAPDTGCSHVIQLCRIVGAIGHFHKLPDTLTEVNNALSTPSCARR